MSAVVCAGIAWVHDAVGDGSKRSIVATFGAIVSVVVVFPRLWVAEPWEDFGTRPGPDEFLFVVVAAEGCRFGEFGDGSSD